MRTVITIEEAKKIKSVAHKGTLELAHELVTSLDLDEMALGYASNGVSGVTAIKISGDADTTLYIDTDQGYIVSAEISDDNMQQHIIDMDYDVSPEEWIDDWNWVA